MVAVIHTNITTLPLPWSTQYWAGGSHISATHSLLDPEAVLGMLCDEHIRFEMTCAFASIEMYDLVSTKASKQHQDPNQNFTTAQIIGQLITKIITQYHNLGTW